MSQYLEEAAALLRKAVQTSERDNVNAPSRLSHDRERFAAQFAVLAAIETGALPTELAHDLVQRTGWSS